MRIQECENVKVGIQDSFAGWTFDDVIKQVEKERRKQKIKSKKQEARRKKKDARNGSQLPINSSRTTNNGAQQERNKGKRVFTIREEPEMIIVQEYEWSGTKIRLAPTETHKYTNKYMKNGMIQSYEEWEEDAQTKHRNNLLVPASLTEFHTLARAAYENRNSAQRTVALNTRELIYQCLTDDAFGFYTTLLMIGGKKSYYPLTSPVAVIHSQKAHNDVRTMHNKIRTPQNNRQRTTLTPRDADSTIICKEIFGDTSVQRVIDVYNWIAKRDTTNTRQELEINVTRIEDTAIPKIEITGIDITLDIRDYKRDHEYRTIGVRRE